MGRGGHLLPGLLQHADHLIVGGLAGKVAELVFEEHHAQGVFQDLHLRILRQILLEVQAMDPRNYVFRIANLAQNVAGLLGVEMLKPLAPFQVARARHRIRIPRHHPAAEMLAARSQTKRLRGLGTELEHPLRQPLRVDQFAWVGATRDAFDVRVAGVLLVETSQRGFEPVRLPGLVTLSHCLGLIAKVRYGRKQRCMSVMTKPLSSGPPSPEEFQRQMSEFMRQHLQAARMPPTPEVESAGPPESAAPPQKADQFQFKYKPREVKEYLDRFVIKQDEAKKVLSVALCDHYHHVRLALEGKESPNYAKQNIILIGPTGVGKTFLIRSAADLIGVPFVKADATKFSQPGSLRRARHHQV